MKKISFVFLLLFCSSMVVLTSCFAPHYEPLPVLPDYHQTLKSWRTDAVVLVHPSKNVSVDKHFMKMLHLYGYKVVTEPDPQMPIDWVIQPLEIHHFIRLQKEGKYLDTRILLQIRNPGMVQNKILRYSRSRYFQAWDRSFTGKDSLEPEQLESLKRKAVLRAVENLFRTNEFRKALVPEFTRKR